MPDKEREAFYRNARPDAIGPLEGIRVLDITTTWAGPRCAAVLADYGADVIKVELPGSGDVARRLPPFLPGFDPPDSFLNATVNKNKKSICLDLRKPEGRDTLHRLSADCDIVVENFKKGTMASWGCGYSDIEACNPDVIYVSITGFGQYGPYSNRAGSDPSGQAISGYMEINAAPDGETPLKAPVFLADELAGIHGAMAAMAALRYREHTGAGQHVDVSLLDVMMDSGTGLHTLAANGIPTPRMGNTYAFVAPGNTYRCHDGWVFAGALLDAHWKRIAVLIGKPELAEHPDYSTIPGRLERREEVDQILADWCAERSRDAVVEQFSESGLLAGPILSPAEAVEDPHVLAREAIQEVTGPQGSFRLSAPAAKFSKTPIRIRRVAPTLGADTKEVLAEAGLSTGEIEELAKKKII